MAIGHARHPKADVLIVDDTAANLQLLSKMLSEQGYRVRPVPDGFLALSAARAEPPDLILLDIRMPKMDGYQVCKRLKEDAGTADIPIIFISALGATKDKIRAFRAGGLDYITKPFQIEEVLARVETHLALMQLQKELQEANEKMELELNLAGEVQASFLPQSPPSIKGWQLAATLKPAREASGDFYDFIPLLDSRWGIVVADVTDKGAAAALYMALCCTLLRTYAAEYPAHPELALGEVNNRILKDTKANQFVTMVYGILDPSTGKLIYSNAGHPPPFKLHTGHGEGVQELARTGIPLGIYAGNTWKQEVVTFGAGDLLVLYSDGITEAFNKSAELYGEERFKDSLLAHRGQSAREISESILLDLHNFVGCAPRSDDIALMVIIKE